VRLAPRGVCTNRVRTRRAGGTLTDSARERALDCPGHEGPVGDPPLRVGNPLSKLARRVLVHRTPDNWHRAVQVGQEVRERVTSWKTACSGGWTLAPHVRDSTLQVDGELVRHGEETCICVPGTAT
jgi:hypothetical protein